MSAAVCHYCDATIRFVVQASGPPIPVDPVPHERGRIAGQPRGSAIVGYPISQARPLLPGHRTYVAHRASCHPEKPRVLAADRAPSLLDA